MTRIRCPAVGMIVKGRSLGSDAGVELNGGTTFESFHIS
jgi:hypothetical protein